MIVGWTTQPITLDGKLDEPAWKDAQASGDFCLLGTEPKSPTAQTSVKVLTDGQNLLFGFRCADPNMQELLASEKPRDGQVYLDDSLEVILDPTNERRAIYHLAANAAGSLFDANGEPHGTGITERKEWDGVWQVATSRDKDAWYSEWKLPLKEFGVSERFPFSLGINFCRTRPRGGKMEFSSWSPCDMRFIAPDRLGELTFASAQDECWVGQFPGVSILPPEQKLPSFLIESRSDKSKTLCLSYELAGPTSSPVTYDSQPFTLSARTCIKRSLECVPSQQGPHRLTVRLIDAQTSQKLHVLTRHFEVRPELEVAERPWALYANRAEALLRTSRQEAAQSGATVQVSLVREGEAKALETLQIAISLGERLPVSFSLSGRPAGRYIIKAELSAQGRTLASAQSQALGYDPQAKTRFTPEGTLLVDEKPFFPVGMYTLQDREGNHDKVLREARAAGFNTTVFYATETTTVLPLLDAAARNGIRAFVYPTPPFTVNMRHSTPEEIRSDVEARTTHPALLGWYVVDEPEGIGETDVHGVRRAYQAVKQLDTKHPTSLVIMTPEAAKLYGEQADVVWVDPYPVPDMPVTFVSQCVSGTREAVADAKPVWAVLQAFDWNVWRKGAIDRIHRPTPDEERCMTYLALVHGAKGVIYWAYTSSKYQMRDYPEHWETMKRLAGELRDLSPVLLTKDAKTTVSVSPEKATLDLMVKQLDGQSYVFAVNRETSACQAKLHLDSAPQEESAEVLFESRQVSLKGGEWSDSFQPLAVHVYRLGKKQGSGK